METPLNTQTPSPTETVAPAEALPPPTVVTKGNLADTNPVLFGQLSDHFAAMAAQQGAPGMKVNPEVWGVRGPDAQQVTGELRERMSTVIQKRPEKYGGLGIADLALPTGQPGTGETVGTILTMSNSLEGEVFDQAVAGLAQDTNQLLENDGLPHRL